jgi:Icc-related predicted phosphoesterase
MKILALADLHSEEMILTLLEKHLKNNKYDIITISGDITNFGPVSYVEKLIKILKNEKVFAVLGNCDPLEIKKILGNYCIENKTENFNNYNITGIGGSIKHTSYFQNQPGVKTEKEFENEINKLNINNKTIFISHSPPLNILDQTFDFLHIGINAFNKMIEEKQPLLFICGHVHEECDFKKIGNTTVINLPPTKKLKAGVINIDEQTNKIKIEFIDL